jgi:hypothetical protein
MRFAKILSISSGDTNGLFGVSPDFLVLDGGGGGGGGITTEEPLVDGLGEFVGTGVVVDAGVVVGFGVEEGERDELFAGVGGVGVGVGVETVVGFGTVGGGAVGVGVGVGAMTGELVELGLGAVGAGIGETGSGTNGDKMVGFVCCADVEETIKTIAVADSKPFAPRKTDLWLITFTLSPFPFPLYLHPPATAEPESHPIAAELSPEHTLDRLHTSAYSPVARPTSLAVPYRQKVRQCPSIL